MRDILQEFQSTESDWSIARKIPSPCARSSTINANSIQFRVQKIVGNRRNVIAAQLETFNSRSNEKWSRQLEHACRSLERFRGGLKNRRISSPNNSKWTAMTLNLRYASIGERRACASWLTLKRSKCGSRRQFDNCIWNEPAAWTSILLTIWSRLSANFGLFSILVIPGWRRKKRIATR